MKWKANTPARACRGRCRRRLQQRQQPPRNMGSRWSLGCSHGLALSKARAGKRGQGRGARGPGPSHLHPRLSVFVAVDSVSWLPGLPPLALPSARASGSPELSPVTVAGAAGDSHPFPVSTRHRYHKRPAAAPKNRPLEVSKTVLHGVSLPKRQKPLDFQRLSLERATRFELATLSLGS